jgi:dihydroorotate dehydrogenase (fumarate)
VETWEDGVRAILAGAHAVQLVSALLIHGPKHLRTMVSGLSDWMHRHQFASVHDCRGLVSLRAMPDPGAFERAGYIRTLMAAADGPAAPPVMTAPSKGE